MKLYRLLFAVFSFNFIFGILLASSAAAQQQQQQDEWRQARSKNFLIVGDVSEKELRDAARRLEQFRETFREFFAADVSFDSPLPVRVAVLKNRSLTTGGQKNIAADNFDNGAAIGYFIFAADGDKPLDWQTLFHAYAHFLVNENLGRSFVPPWLNEGLAEYFETFQIGIDGTATFGDLSDEHSILLRENKLIPLETFFETDYYSLRKQGNHGAGLFYAQARALTHFLMQSEDGARRRQIKEFIGLALSGKNQRHAFNEAFQTDYAAMENELKKYVERKNFSRAARVIKNKTPLDGEIASAPLSEAEAKIVAGEMLYQTGDFPAAAKEFEAAIKLGGDASRAYASLALAKLRLGKFDEALKLSEKAVALDDENYFVHYVRADVLSREGMTDYGFVSNYTAAQASLIRESLDAAIKLNPNFADGYNLYAFVNFVRNESFEQANEHLARALKLAPGNQQYQMRAAELAMRAEDFAKARRTARRIYETAPDDRLRVYAKNLIHTIDNYESQLESLRNPNRRRRLNEVTDQPLTDEESARLNHLAMIEAINDNLRRLKSNEKRILGYLTRVECRAAGSIEFTIKSENRQLRLSAETFDALTLVSYSRESSGGQVGCETFKKAAFAVVVYRPLPSAQANGKSAGEIVSIEFVPENFKFLN